MAPKKKKGEGFKNKGHKDKMAPKKKRKRSVAPAAKKRKAKRRTEPEAKESKASDNKERVVDEENELPIIEPEDDEEPKMPEPDEEQEDDGSNPIEINIPEVVQKLQSLCSLPRKPCEYFAERSADITISRKGSEILRTTSDFTQFPKDLTDICISYYEENTEMFVQRVIDDFNYFGDGTVAARLRKLVKTREKERVEVDILLHKMSHRSPDYSKWFWIRRDLPTCISLDDIMIERVDDHNTLMAEEGYEIGGLCLHNPQIGLPPLLVGVPETPPEHGCVEWTALFDSIPHEDLIGPCLQKRTTLDQFMKCSVELEARTKKSKDKWLSFLFDLHRAYAAIHLWIADGQTFENLDDPLEARLQATILWDRFHRKYKCGQRICSWPEDKEREEEKKT